MNAAVRTVSAVVDDRERLRQLYAAKPRDHRAVAIAEREVWEAFLASCAGKKPRRDYWFFETFGLDGPAEVMFRQGILSREPWSEPLWPLIERFSLNKIYRICNDLRNNPNCADVVKRLVDNPDEIRRYKLPDSRRNGKPVKMVDCSPGAAKEIRARLRDVVKPFVAQKLSELGEANAADEIVAEFELEVQAAFSDLLTKIDRLRHHSGAKLMIETRRRDLRRACEFLGIKLPPKGGAIDMDQARRAHRKLSAQFHPDRTNGNEQLASQYIEVQRAWEIVSNYQA